MKYARSVVRCARVSVRNPFAVLLVSLGTTVSLLPFVTGALLAGTFGGLIGLWTTSFMLGFVAVGGARIATVTLEREVSLGTDYFWEGLRKGTVMGPVVGVGTFVAAVIAIVLSSIPASGVVGMSLALLGLYVLLGWFIWAMFALTLWAAFENPRGPRSAFVDGGTLILEQPVAAGWLLVQAVGWTLLSVPLIIAPALLLPGFVQIIGTAIVRLAATESTSHAPVVMPDGGCPVQLDVPSSDSPVAVLATLSTRVDRRSGGEKRQHSGQEQHECDDRDASDYRRRKRDC